MAKTELPKVSAFISYAHVDRKFGGQVKQIFTDVGIETFLAHEDLEVSDEWRQRILEELRRCDLFVPLLSVNFLTSKWAPQEAGFIISRPEVTIVPLSIDETTPCGFLSHLQSLRIPSQGLTRALLVEPLTRRSPRKILPGLIRIVSEAETFRSAEAKMRPLVPYFPILTPEEAQALAEASVENGQIWSAGQCRGEYLPELIRVQGANINPNTLLALQYQVKHDRQYPGDGPRET
jgi:TIR domain